MNVSRRTLLTSALGLGAGALLTSCSADQGGGTAGTGTLDPSDVSGEITVLTPTYADEAAQQVFANAVAAFNRDYPDVTVTPDFTDFSKLNEKLTVALASGLVPDVIMSGVGWVEPYASKGIYAEFSPEVTEGVEYRPEILRPCTFEDKLYAIPVLLDTRGIIYNEALFAQAGITEPPRSFADLRSAAKELTGGSGSSRQWGIMIAGWSPRQLLATLLGAKDAQMFGDDGQTPLFTSDAALESMQLLVDMINDGSTSWDLAPAEGSPNPFLGGNIAMTPYASSSWTAWSEGAPELMEEGATGLFLPQDVRASQFLGGTMVSRSATSQNPDAADAFVRALTGQEASLAICEYTNAVPPVAEWLGSSDLANNRFVSEGAANLEYSSSEGGSPAWMEIRGELDAILEEALIGQSDVETVMAKANTMAQEAIDRLA